MSGPGTLTQTQRAHLRHWIVIAAVAEAAMILLNRYLTVLYLAVAVLFLAGFGLRLFNRYPGKEEPLALDGSAVAIAILFAYISLGLSGPPRTVGLRIVLILCSSLIIVPHLLYIIRERDL